MTNRSSMDPSGTSGGVVLEGEASDDGPKDSRIRSLFRRHRDSSRVSESASHHKRFMATLLRLNDNVSGVSSIESQNAVPSSPPRTPGPKATLVHGLAKMSTAFFRVPVHPTVIHRQASKARLPLQTVHNPDTLGSSPTTVVNASPVSSIPTSGRTTSAGSPTSVHSPASANSPTSKSSRSPTHSTSKAWLDARLQLPSWAREKHVHHAGLAEKRLVLLDGDNNDGNNNNNEHDYEQHSPPNTTSGIPMDNPLTPVEEDPLDGVSAGVLTVERAAAAKIYLETYFDAKLACGPSPRSLRLQQLKAKLYARNGSGLFAPLQCGGFAEREREVAGLARADFFRRESEYLREVRSMKVRSIRALGAPRGSLRGCIIGETYEVVRVLGKGSFGVVQLVREKGGSSDYEDRRRCDCCWPANSSMMTGDAGGEGGGRRRGSKQVYAMKVIRKSAMLHTGQESHLRAERDFLVASEGSEWIVPLVASLQDAVNLYLVMEYMPGGDFLGLLIRENTLREPVARFYIAEMIVCVEAAHTLRCIHRDIKPDNFLISASGHLKISDFGLAFDGHWAHDMAYYDSHRYSLVNKLGIHIDGDEQASGGGATMYCGRKGADIERHEKRDLDDGEPLLNWRNRCGYRTSAMSVVGTSQYMAPEVIEGRKYDARCDWWSIGIILFECLFGHTPFLAEEGRHMTKQNILRHKELFIVPTTPVVSNRCRQLLYSLIQDKEQRLSSRRYQDKDNNGSNSPGSSSGQAFGGNDGNSDVLRDHPAAGNRGSPSRTHRDVNGRYVFPNDAEDIKAHKWFKDVDWEHLHELDPPYIPCLHSAEDTHYFDDGLELSEWSDSHSSDSSTLDTESPPSAIQHTPTMFPNPTAPAEVPFVTWGDHQPTRKGLGPQVKARLREEEARHVLRGLRPSLQVWAMEAIATPHDAQRLRELDAHIEEMGADTGAGLDPNVQSLLKRFVRTFGRKERKRPRDRLLRDRASRRIAMDVRRKTAFMGYTWRRVRPRVASWERHCVEEGEVVVTEAQMRGGTEQMTGGVRDAEKEQAQFEQGSGYFSGDDNDDFPGASDFDDVPGYDGIEDWGDDFGGWSRGVVAVQAVHRQDRMMMGLPRE